MKVKQTKKSTCHNTLNIRKFVDLVINEKLQIVIIEKKKINNNACNF